MADPFESELQTLISKVARELAHDITRLILRRLGLESAGRSARGKRLGNGQVSQALRQAAGKAPAPRIAAGRRRAGKGSASPATTASTTRARPSAEERAAAYERVAQVVSAGAGMSVGDIERRTSISRSVVVAALKALKEQGRVFMGGTKRFARYAATQPAADKASADARGHAGPDTH
ncbi:MAG: hypothetical protein U0359_40445 [Byssovorax sp.]